MDKKDIIIGKLNSNVKFGKRDGWLWSSLFWSYEDFLNLKIFKFLVIDKCEKKW